jgi:hypothetical protein
MPSFRTATHNVAGLDEIAGKRAKNRIAFRAAAKAGDTNAAAALAAEFKALGAKLDEATASNPPAKQAVVEREKLLKALGDNREKQVPLMAAITARGDKTQLSQEIGGLAGRILLAILVVTALSRPALLRVFIIPGLIMLPITYLTLYHSSSTAFSIGIFVCGMMVVSQFSYFGEYLPKAFPLHLRGTGGSFATNVGGRMLGTSAAFLTTNIVAPLFSSRPTPDHYAMAAGIVGTLAFLIALGLSFALPEPKMEKAD